MKRFWWSYHIEWKPQDCWIGAFWRQDGCCVDLWLCVLPMVPLHVSWWWTNEGRA